MGRRDGDAGLLSASRAVGKRAIERHLELGAEVERSVEQGLARSACEHREHMDRADEGACGCVADLDLADGAQDRPVLGPGHRLPDTHGDRAAKKLEPLLEPLPRALVSVACSSGRLGCRLLSGCSVEALDLQARLWVGR